MVFLHLTRGQLGINALVDDYNAALYRFYFEEENLSSYIAPIADKWVPAAEPTYPSYIPSIYPTAKKMGGFFYDAVLDTMKSTDDSYYQQHIKTEPIKTIVSTLPQTPLEAASLITPQIRLAAKAGSIS